MLYVSVWQMQPGDNYSRSPAETGWLPLNKGPHIRAKHGGKSAIVHES